LEGHSVDVGFGMNSMLDIKKFFETDGKPLGDHEFKEFWMSLSKEEREEFRKAKLS
jgi:hypothetical protein